MEAQNINAIISTDLDAFYLRCINPKNDAWLNKQGYKSSNQVRTAIRKNPVVLNLFNSFLNNYYFLHDEYVVLYSNISMIMTNYRLIIFDGKMSISIILANIKSYELSGNSMIVTYLHGDSERKTYCAEWITESYFFNSLQRHQDKTKGLSPIEIDVLELGKSEINTKYNFAPTTTQVADRPIREINYRGLVAVLFIVSMFGGCYYWISSNDTPIDYDAMEQRNKTNHVGEVKCDWCGGIGSVGYAGKSEEQYKRTGMGLGNKCITCGGSGYVKKE